MKTWTLLLSILLGCGANAYVLAAAPTVSGDFITDIKLGSVTNVAVADGSVAQVIIGSITDDTTIQGDFNSTVAAGAITNAAVGNTSCAQIIIGSLVGTITCLSPSGL